MFGANSGNCSSASAPMLLPDEHSFIATRDVLRQVVAKTIVRRNSLDLGLVYNPSDVFTNSTTNRNTASHPLTSGLSDLGDVGLETDDSSFGFNLMDDDETIRMDEVDFGASKDINETDDVSVVSISSNKGLLLRQSESLAKTLFSQGRECVHPTLNASRRLEFPDIFQRRWLAAHETPIAINKSHEKMIKSLMNTNNGGRNNESPSRYLIWFRLCRLMKKSCRSQAALQDWDRMNGLPASHARTMVKTGRSRVQLQNFTL